MVDKRCRARVDRPQIELELSRAALHRALGPHGMPATLAFSFDCLTVITPSGNVRVRGRTVADAAGSHNAGLRPRDADVLREATDGTDATVILAADPLTLKLTQAGTTVVTGRW